MCGEGAPLTRGSAGRTADVSRLCAPPGTAAGAPGRGVQEPGHGGEVRGGPEPCARAAATMVLSVPVIALGATLGTATSILALCGVTCLCRHMHPKKGLLQRDREPDPEKARPGVLGPAQQVSRGVGVGGWGRSASISRGD